MKTNRPPVSCDSQTTQNSNNYRIPLAKFKNKLQEPMCG